MSYSKVVVVGNDLLFAIECKIESVERGWVIGHLRFWLRGQPAGDWDDFVDLRGCASWLRDFATIQVDRTKPELFRAPANEVFRLLFDSFMPVGKPDAGGWSPDHGDLHRRFHISHLGMSSFDHFDFLLIEDSTEQRCLWRDARDKIIHDAVFPVNTMESVARDFCIWLERSVKDT